MTKDEAMKTGHELDIYLDSEMADEKTGRLDELWQSIYDVVQLADGGIIESDQREINAAIVWLKEAQSLTDDYKDMAIPFEVKEC